MSPEEIVLKITETSLSALGMFFMYRLAVLALNNKKTGQ